MVKIAFVCHGNICRSPMAEFVFKNMIVSRGQDRGFLVVSRATSDEEIYMGKGNPIHHGTLGIFKKYNIPFDKTKEATQLTEDDYQKYDLFVGMDHANIRNMRRLFGGDPECKVKLLLEYTGEEKEVADPWYTGDFEQTYQDVTKGCLALLATLGEEK